MKNTSRAIIWRRLWAMIATLALAITLIGVTQADSTAAKPRPGRPEVEKADATSTQDVARRRLPAKSSQHKASSRRSQTIANRPVAWPNSAEGAVGGTHGSSVKLGPVTIEAEPDTGERTIRVIDRDVTDRAGVDGVLVEVGGVPTSEVTSAKPSSTKIEIDLRGFEHAYGADWPNRLQARAYPACLLTTPKRPACQVSTPVESQVDTDAHAITATLADSQARQTTVVALAATAASTSGTGDFSATPLAQSATWSAGGSSGNFAWNYPIRAIPANNGPAPTLALNYSSQTVDGRTAASNNQASQLGEGWDAGNSYIERGYVTCKDDGVAGKYDLCWKSDNAQIVLNGQSAELIKRSDGTWRLSNDDGSRVRRLTSTAVGNQDNDKEYWELTSSDGTKYYFGRTAIPDQTGDPQSVWWVPVNGNNSGEPCYSSGTTYATRFCKQAWRWNLDYIVDPHGNAVSYWYTAEANYYAKNQVASPGTQYIRGGRLTRIDYGLRAGSTAAAPFQVAFTGSLRCLATTGCDTYSKAKWPDTPYDQICVGTAACTGKFAPTFFTRYRLSKITTKIRKSAAYSDVESWSFAHEFLNSGDVSDGTLWLAGITHAGLVGGTVTDPEVTFGSVQLTNRVNTVADGISSLPRYRVRTITSETGAVTTVNYSDPQCVAGNLPTPDSNTMRCYPQKWTPEGNTSPRTDWFHKYVVASVSTADTTGLAPAVQTYYTYAGGAAWAYNDNKIIPDGYRTWSQWRGFQEVTTVVGDPSDTVERPKTTTTYFQGMSGDKQSSGVPRTASVTASDGTSVTDERALAGRPLEIIKYTKEGGTAHQGIITIPWVKATAGGGLKAAWFVGDAETRARSILANGQWRRRTVTREFDGNTGQVTRVSDSGDLSTGNDQTCTATSYADTQSTSGAWFVGFPARVVRSEGLCDSSALDPTESTVLSDDRTSYDGLTVGTAPTKGLPTKTERLAEFVSAAPTYQVTAVNEYDAFGRPKSVTRPSAQGTSSTIKNTVAYTMSADGTLATTVNTQDAGGKAFATTTSNAPEWGVATKIVDPNNKSTDIAYDPSGRVASVWLTNRARTATPSLKYTYTLSKMSASSVKTSTLTADGQAYVDSFEVYDALLRPRQEQDPTPAGGRIISGATYDSRGQQNQAIADVYASGAPSGGLVEFPDGAVPQLTKLTFDGLGRNTKSTLYTNNTQRWSTTTTYDGSDVTKTIPPNGAPPTTVVVDVRGRTIRSVEHGTPDLTTNYTYDLNDHLVGLASPAGSSTYRFDLRGRKIEATDPDTGSTTTVYTDSDKVLSTTDARGKSLYNTYDNLDRMTGQYAATTADSSKLVKAWTYDTVAKGYPSSQTRYIGGLTGDRIETKVVSYTAAYQPSETKMTLTGAAGSSRFAGLPTVLSRNLVYNVDQSVAVNYLPRVTVGSTTILSTEPLAYEYDSLGLVEQIRGLTGFIQDVTYDQLRQPQQVVAGRGAGYQLYSTREYDEGTNRLARAAVTSNLSSAGIADPHYSYDDAGNPTRVSDSVTEDTQCFRYDDHRRLSEAWTPDGGDCAAASSSSPLGGPAPFRQTWSFKNSGLRETQTTTSPAGTVQDNYEYPSSSDPHRNFASSVTRTAGGTNFTLAYSPDQSGNTLSRPDAAGTAQTLEWDNEGNLTKITDADGHETTYVYGVDDVLLVRESSTERTLFAGDTEVTYSKSGNVTTAKRLYSSGLGILGVRHGDDPGDLTLQIADPQGTASISLDATTLQPRYRFQTPYGERRGAEPAVWPDTRGFLNKPADADTGLVSVGAREYDPSGGRFISADPLLIADDPAQTLGYSYANNNPMTLADASGLASVCILEGTCNYTSNPAGGAPIVTGPKDSTPSSSPAPSGSSRGTSSSKSGSGSQQEKRGGILSGPDAYSNLIIGLSGLAIEYSFEHARSNLENKHIGPRILALNLLFLGGSGSEEKRALRESGRALAVSLGYGNGRNEKANIAADVSKFRKAVKVLGIAGVLYGTYDTGKEEWEGNSDKDTGERTGRTVISTTSKVAFGTGFAAVGGTICSPGVVLSALCATGGALVGEKVGGAVGNLINFIAFGD